MIHLANINWKELSFSIELVLLTAIIDSGNENGEFAFAKAKFPSNIKYF
ncbi:hypothetical protein [Nonlabens marinus]|uniref:Uncharacterized protein n=1 Tax=Nonlabens marinus S1-08 TaxID=1454201 RepID=W8W0F5_9FLAO|nr:hypothetical protein [Nonlabens marinus]BAO56236.1 hypothetical protein NMS_2227 [Nonlabens marinus S1-08]